MSRRTIAMRASFVLALAAVSCSSGQNRSVEVVASTEQRLLQDPFTLQVTLPGNILIGAAPVAAAGSLQVGDRDKIGGSVVSASGDVTLGNDEQAGSVVSGGNVILRDRATVNGNVSAAGKLMLGNSDVISGTVTTQGAIPSTTVSWTVTPPTQSLGTVNVPPSGSVALQPGLYDSVTANARSTIALQSGTYVFSSLDLEPQARLVIDSRNGPVIVYVQSNLTYRGTVASVDSGLPQLFMAYLGTAPVTLSAPYTGVFFAPSTQLNLQPGNNLVNTATLYGQSVVIQPDAIVNPFPFDFSVFGLPPNPDDAAPRPAFSIPTSSVNLVADMPGDATGSSTATADPPTPSTFTLPTSFEVSSGVIANGTVTLTFQYNGATTTCTYQGGASTNLPTDPGDLNAGRLLTFVSCSDGQPANVSRTGSHFSLTVNRTSSLPVSVNLSLDDNGCSQTFEILSAVDTYNMHKAFTWKGKTQVSANNPDGTPAVYYAWVYAKSHADLKLLSQLYVHVLPRPLFTSELNAYAGQCGTISNPGDGLGAFVPVLIPGLVYNKLLEIQNSDKVKGNRYPFDAVILRQPPSGAANANGSVSYTVLREANLHYMGGTYGVPLPAQSSITQNAFIVDDIADAVSWLVNAVKDIGDAILSGIGALDGLFGGTVKMDMNIRQLNLATDFDKNAPMVRAWGPLQGNPLAAGGLKVTLMENLWGFIPTEFNSNTQANGNVVMNPAKDDTRGSGICVALENEAARVSDFITTNSVCDFRNFKALKGTAGVGHLDFHQDQTIDVNFADPQLNLMYQMDDVHRYLKDVVGHTTKQARVLTGFWANTFSSSSGGEKIAFTPCLDFDNSIGPTIETVATAVTTTVGWSVGPIGAALGAIGGSVVSHLLVDNDMILPSNSSIRHSREMGSHEYGHFSFCSLGNEVNSGTVDDIILPIALRGNDLSLADRYIFEGWAEFITGQVTSIANYDWLLQPPAKSGDSWTRYSVCDPSRNTSCFDTNRNGNDPAGTMEAGRMQIAKVATLLHDLFDDEHTRANGDKLKNTPDDGDAWVQNTTAQYVYSKSGSGNLTDEKVTLPGKAIADLAHNMASRLGLGDGLTDSLLYQAINQTMLAYEVGYCDRCDVFALHSQQCTSCSTSTPLEIDKITACLNDSQIAAVLGTGEPSSCIDNCPADLVIDGTTMSLGEQQLDVTQHPAGDPCPDRFVVEVDNPQAVFGPPDNATSVGISFVPPYDAASCTASHDLVVKTLQGSDTVTLYSANVGGSMATCAPGQSPCLSLCNGLPSFGVDGADVPSTVLRFETSAVTGRTITLGVYTPQQPPL